MKNLTVFLYFLSSLASAGEITLHTGKGYVVPDGKIWVIKSAPVAECRVCTADVHVKADSSGVEIAGVTLNGSFDLSINSAAHQAVKLYSGAEIWLGDSRGEIKVNEESD